jgi:hypothetical protein
LHDFSSSTTVIVKLHRFWSSGQRWFARAGLSPQLASGLRIRGLEWKDSWSQRMRRGLPGTRAARQSIADK